MVKNADHSGQKSHSIIPSKGVARQALQRIAIGTARVLLVLLFGIGFFLSIVPFGRANARALWLLPALITASEPTPLVLSGEPVRHSQKTIPSRGGTVYLDMYTPDAFPPLVSGARGGILIVPGAGDNRKVPQLINLSQSLARTGLVVMDMTTPTLMNYDISALDSDAVVEAFNALARFSGIEKKHIGIVAFSAGVPITCFAAADPRIQDQVAFIALFGGYYNTTSVLRAFGRRAITVDGHTEAWQPTEVPIQLLANVITRTLVFDERISIINAVAPGGNRLTPNKLKHFSPEARAAYHLLIGDEPDRVEMNIAALSTSMQMLLNELSPSRVINSIRTPVYLLHDRNDSSLPVTESRDFAAALAHIKSIHDYVEFHIFDHVEVRMGLNVGQLAGDGFHLFTVLSEVLFADTQGDGRF